LKIIPASEFRAEDPAHSTTHDRACSFYETSGAPPDFVKAKKWGHF
jgi:hypothetical protein